MSVRSPLQDRKIGSLWRGRSNLTDAYSLSVGKIPPSLEEVS